MTNAIKHTDHGKEWIAVVIVTVGVFMALLDTTIVNIVLPKMMSTLEADLYGIQWVVISYFLGSVISMTTVGWLGDRFGATHVFLIGLGIFTGMSALCGMASSLELMETFRFCQGIGEGFIIPTGLVVLFEIFPREKHGMAMGLYGLGAALAPSLGPTLGGVITEHLSWRWIFYVNLPFGIAGVIAGWFYLKRVCLEKTSKVPFDSLGFILMTISLSSLIIFLSKGQEKGWLESDYILALVIIFVVTFIPFVIWQWYYKHPLINLNLFKNRTYAIGVAVLAVFSLVTYGFWLLLPIYLERLRQYPTLTSGLILLPGSLIGGLAILGSGILSDRWRPKTILIICLLGVGLMGFNFHTGVETSKHVVAWDYTKWVVFVGGVFTPLVVIALSDLPDRLLNMGSTTLNVIRLIFGSIGTSYAVSLLSNKTSTFYTILSSKINFGSPTTRQLIGREMFLQGQTAAGAFVKRAQMMLEMYIMRDASSYAFESVFRTLGILTCILVIGALFIRYRKKKHSGLIVH